MKEMILAVCLLLFCGVPASGVVIASGDGRGNTSPPADDFGWAHLGRLGSVSAVGLGGSCVLTAWHAIRRPHNPDARFEVDFAGRTHRLVRGSEHVLGAGRFPEPADLAMFRVEPPTDLAPLAVSATPLPLGARVILVGYGRNRRPSPKAWDAEWAPAERGQHAYLGFPWAKGTQLRWGTNAVAQIGLRVTKDGTQTLSFATRFDRRRGTEHEAQAAIGDSGGGAFAHIDGAWKLAGILFGVGTEPGQSKSAVFGNFTLIADLVPYREEILEMLARDCQPAEKP